MSYVASLPVAAQVVTAWLPPEELIRYTSLFDPALLPAVDILSAMQKPEYEAKLFHLILASHIIPGCRDTGLFEWTAPVVTVSLPPATE